MLTAASLRAYKLKDLAQMAKKRGVPGWHSMRKEQLVGALVRMERAASKTGGKSAAGKTKNAEAKSGKTARTKRDNSSTKSANRTSGIAAKRTADRPRSAASRRKETKRSSAKDPKIVRQIQEAHARRERLRNLASASPYANGDSPEVKRDRIVLMVRDPYWLQAYWELTSRSVDRAQVALAEQWHSAKPILRLARIANANAADGSERVIREIEIHGAVRNWYVDVQDPPSTYRAEIGYLTTLGKFHALARSNTVTTPQPGSTEMLDGHWTDVADNCDKIYAMSGGYENHIRNGELQELFEERLRRPIGSPMVTKFGTGAEAILEKKRGFCFDVDAEMIVYGITKPDAYVTMAGEPVKLRPDGTFTARVGMPEKRQVIPVVASSSDGVEQQTIVLAVERNTKVMEPVVRDLMRDGRG